MIGDVDTPNVSLIVEEGSAVDSIKDGRRAWVSNERSPPNQFNTSFTFHVDEIDLFTLPRHECNDLSFGIDVYVGVIPAEVISEKVR